MSDDFRSQPPRPDLADLLRTFESLGSTCELRLIQRYCGVEQPGLFRFGLTPLRGLIDALDHGFDGVGDPAAIDAEEDNQGEWITTHAGTGSSFIPAIGRPRLGERRSSIR